MTRKIVSERRRDLRVPMKNWARENMAVGTELIKGFALTLGPQ